MNISDVADEQASRQANEGNERCEAAMKYSSSGPCMRGSKNTKHHRSYLSYRSYSQINTRTTRFGSGTCMRGSEHRERGWAGKAHAANIPTTVAETAQTTPSDAADERGDSSVKFSLGSWVGGSESAAKKKPPVDQFASQEQIVINTTNKKKIKVNRVCKKHE